MFHETFVRSIESVQKPIELFGENGLDDQWVELKVGCKKTMRAKNKGKKGNLIALQEGKRIEVSSKKDKKHEREPNCR